MSRFLFPTEYYDSTYSINFEKYYDEGYDTILFDIDNTLVPHDAMHNEKSRELFKRLKAIGFKICFVSNNDEPRVKEFNKEVGAEYIYKAGKPKGQGYINAIRKLKSQRSKTLFIGDQLFTDIWGANNAGLHAILVNPVAPETKFHIVLKRILEYPVKKLYLLNHKIKK